MRDRFQTGRRTRHGKWQLSGGDHALVWRNGAARLVRLGDATPRELSTGIASIEALAVHVLDTFLRSKRAQLDENRRDDAIANLIGQAWLEAQRFNGLGRLGGFVTTRLRWRVLDWYRTEFEHPSTVSVLSSDSEDVPEVADDAWPVVTDEDVDEAAELLHVTSERGRMILRSVVIYQARGVTESDLIRHTGLRRAQIESMCREVAAEYERNAPHE